MKKITIGETTCCPHEEYETKRGVKSKFSNSIDTKSKDVNSNGERAIEMNQKPFLYFVIGSFRI